MQGSTHTTEAVKDSQRPLQDGQAPRIFFALFAAVILAAIFIPSIALINMIVLNGLLVFSVCMLAVAVLARKSRDIVNFPLFATVIVCVRLGLGVNIAKAILLNQEVSKTVSLAGSAFESWYAAAAWCGIAILLTGMGFKLSKAISMAATARMAAAIEDNQLARFYRACAVMGKILAADTAAWLVVTLSTLTATAVLAVMNSSEKTGLGLAIANSAITAVPLGLLLVSFAILMKKNFAPAQTITEMDDQPQKAGAIQVESEVINSEQIDDLDEEVELDRTFDLSSSHLAQYEQEPRAQPAQQEKLSTSIFAADNYYEPITAQILACGKSITIFAGQSKEYLPVTVPVNVAVKLTQMKKRCLLIDNDFVRNAITAVFDLDGQANAGKAVLTDHDFWVSPADEKVPLAKKLKNAMRAFDHVLVYSPSPFMQDLTPLADIAEVKKLAITMGPVEPISAMLDTLEAAGFRIIYDADLTKKAV